MSSNRVSLHRSQHFAVDPTPDVLPLVEAISTSRRAAGQSYLTIRKSIETANQLAGLIDEGKLWADIGAAAEIAQLLAQLARNRGLIRSATRKFKSNAETFENRATKTTPFAHQVRAVGFGLTVDSGALLMDPGTGKSYCAVSISGHRFLDGDVSRVVVTCPKTVMPVWGREFNRHAAFPAEVSQIRTADDFPVHKPGTMQVAVINYDRVKKLLRPIEKWKPEMAIADESHRMQNRSAIRSKAMHYLGDRIRHKLLLSGSPLGQTPLSIWSQFRFALPDVFGRDYKNFEGRYAKMGGYMGYEVVGFKNLDEMADRIHENSFRCTVDECLALPPVRNVRIHCQAEERVRRFYNELNEELIAEIDGEEISVDLVVSKLMKLRQITGGLVKGDGQKLIKVSEAKTQTIKRRLRERSWEGKLVVFCSFSHEIELMDELCKSLGLGRYILTGSTKDSERARIQTEFQGAGEPVIISQVGVGAEGIDLFAANEDIFFSPTYSYIQNEQARARIRRIGQTRRVRHSYAVMSDTVDEDILDFLQEHGSLTRKILDGMRTYRVSSK